MPLKELTESGVREFAGGTIFNRRYDYFEQEMVYEFDYDPTADRIVAETMKLKSLQRTEKLAHIKPNGFAEFSKADYPAVGEDYSRKPV